MKITIKFNLIKKLMLIVLSISVLTLGITVFVLTNQSSGQITELSLNSGKNLAKENAYAIKSEIEAALDSARTLSETMEGSVGQGGTMTREVANNILKRVLDANPNFLGVYVGFEPNAFDGKDKQYQNTLGHDTSGRFVPYWNRIGGSVNMVPMVDYDKEGAGDYYLTPKKTGQETIVEPYIYEGALMTSLCVPIHDKYNKFIGIVGVDIDLYPLSKKINQKKILTSGYSFLLSNQGIYAGHPEELLMGYAKPDQINVNQIAKSTTDGTNSYMKSKATQEALGNLAKFATRQEKTKAVQQQILSKMQEGKEGYVEVNDAYYQKDGYIVFVPVNIGKTTTPWSFAVSLPKDEILEPVTRMTQLGLLVAFISIVLLALVLIFTVRKLFIPLASLETAAKKLTEGDLTVKLDNVKTNDEIGQLARTFEQMVEAIKKLMTDLQKKAGTLSETSGNLTNNAQQTAAGAVQTATTMNEIASNVDHVSANTQAVAGAARQVASLADGGRKSLDIVSNQMATISGGFDQVNSAIKELAQQSAKIGQIVDLITQVAEQTNLLALNAAIEAARAGEAGRGFAVVADEVRKLAEQSARAAKDIKSLIEEVQNSSHKAEDIMLISADNVSSGTRTVDEAGTQFIVIIENIGELTQQVLQVAAAAEQMTTGVQNVAAATQQQTASMQEVGSSLDALNLIANELLDMSEQFRI